MKYTLTLLLSAFLLGGVPGVSAQEQEAEKPRKPIFLSVEEIAKKQTDRLQFELSLTPKQYKKIYTYYKKEENARRKSMENSFEKGDRPMSPPPGRGSKGERPPMGNAPGFNGRNSMSETRTGVSPTGHALQKQTEVWNQEKKKFKKILSPEQYQKWLTLPQNRPIQHRESPQKEYPGESKHTLQSSAQPQ